MTVKLMSPRRWLALGLVLAAVALSACGGGGSSASKSSSAPGATTTSGSGGSSSGGIPQGPNAGDKDSDNQGGPSDGDGNI